MKIDESHRPYTYSDLVRAVKDYDLAREIFDDKTRMVAAKKNEMDSFQQQADQAFGDVERRKIEIRKILRNLEE